MLLATVDEFGRDPVGRFVCGERFVHFCVAPKLWGIVVWDRPAEADVLEIYRSLPFEFGPPAVPHAAVIDASRMEGSEPAAFTRIERFLTKYGAPLEHSILRLALVKPGGFAGAIVAGAHATLRFPLPVEIFDDLASALGWLAPVTELSTSPGETAEVLERMQEQASATPGLLRELRLYLEANLEKPSVADAARALRTSDRSLQRKLSNAGTTLQDEVSLARVRVAKRLLENPKAQTTEVAIAVGCSSLQHFSTLFKRVTGLSPSAWRKRELGT